MNTDELLLIDLSALAHQIYHVSGSEPDPSYVSTQIVARVRALSTAHPHAAICCDAPPYLRKAIDPSYKATRPEAIAPLLHQMRVAEERLATDGYPVWKVQGFEADDIIASATRRALEIEGATVLIASSDKDLLQLVGPRVTTKSLTTGNIVDEAAVVAKFGVAPSQMLDYLCLVGDASDNIIGAKGIGPVTAAKLLADGSLAQVYAAMARGVVPGMTTAQRTSLKDFEARWETVRALITLRTDMEIPFEEIAAERTAAPMTEEMSMDETNDNDEPASGLVDIMERQIQQRMDAAGVHDPNGLRARQGNAALDRELTGAEVTAELRAAMAAKAAALKADSASASQPSAPNGADSGNAGVAGVSRPSVYDAERTPASLVPYAPVDFSQQLEPRHMDDAVKLAQRMFESRLFSAYGTPQAVLATILAGRELGIPAMASLRAFHIIEGKPTLSAGTIQSLVIKSGKAKYFRCTERTNDRATFDTQRLSAARVTGEDPAMALTVTIEDGRRAFGFTSDLDAKSLAERERKWQASSWGKNPADMLVARAATKLARLVYPDVVSGLYAPEEME